MQLPSPEIGFLCSKSVHLHPYKPEWTLAHLPDSNRSNSTLIILIGITGKWPLGSTSEFRLEVVGHGTRPIVLNGAGKQVNAAGEVDLWQFIWLPQLGSRRGAFHFADYPQPRLTAAPIRTLENPEPKIQASRSVKLRRKRWVRETAIGRTLSRLPSPSRPPDDQIKWNLSW